MPHRHRVTIDLSARLHQRLKVGARLHGISVAAYVRMVLLEQLSGSGAGSPRAALRLNREFLAAVRDPVVGHFKQFVDHEALRRNLPLTPEERMRALGEEMERVRTEPAAPKPEGAAAPDDIPWFGMLNAYAANAKGRHDMESVRASIARARKKKPR